jgi:hypothetical protein
MRSFAISIRKTPNAWVKNARTIHKKHHKGDFLP